MQIIIPMAGTGQRFIDAGFKEIKPLIKIENKPIIEHIIKMFPKNSDFLFICNKDHLKKTRLEHVLKKNSKNPKIVAINQHKLGPVYSILKADKEIKGNTPVIVNYCDFKWHWNFKDFEKKIIETNCDGAITAYTGFHPHLLWGNKYAGMIVKKNKMVKKIKEKHSFTQNPMNSYHSAGTYYFKNGKEMKNYCRELLKKKMTTNNEYYMSTVYDLLLQDKKKIFTYEIEFFLQWGTPQDLNEYVYWSNYFREKQEKIKLKEKTTLLMPMAGEGKRFIVEKYKTPKPLIKINDKPMFLHAVESYQKMDNYVFVCLKKHLKNKIDKKIKKNIPNAKIIIAKKTTQGQASSCLLAEPEINQNLPLLIAACDNKIIWNQKKFEKIVKNKKIKAAIWTFRNNAAINRNPKAYAYVKTRQNNAVFVSCKQTISDSPINDHAVTGTFYFRKAKKFFDMAKKMIEKNIRINNEFYVDTVPNQLIEQGETVKIFEVEKYIVFGTPADLRTHNYWQNYFKKNQK